MNRHNKFGSGETTIITMAAGGPTTYQELFADPSKDPSGPDPTTGYTEIFHRWRADANAPSAADAHNETLTDFESTVGAIGCFVQDSHSDSGVLKVTHGYKKFAGLPRRPTENRGKTFACEGDTVNGLDLETFELDEDHFSILAETSVYSTRDVI